MCSHNKLAVLVSSPVSLSEEPIAPPPTTQQDAPSGFEDTEPVNTSMQEFYQLYQKLLVITLVLTGIIFISVWIFYSLNIALNYLIGACTGVVYLKMLANDVERLGAEKNRLSKNRFALFIGLIILATQWNDLHVMPIFLGFLTYKATLLVYTVQTAFLPDS
ncbi:ATP synthase subunit I [Nostoc sp. FACHB-87]|uniref:ATP synthase subunit I n=1 Tax=Nostocales TaxID=1161 RepID=UPI001683CE66|nr:MULTISPECIES: ATP synthase subunit I [Nostocales]MBD2300815.1 ATP synthase subunit I [Nostoc sp. FACHB-190]MBD2455064.1 ATP synthase subunit I [Nostoc sp. FACHB-87]MBD2477929.1 ATP synthase subunit I [Anabaena sp. FACHB-83]MBD2487342.1 ATP synthase subunit I [Aulosira sp. FACHB-615]MBD2493647.1 ATP synthase subunit I [Nostoc sp. FACHB-280]